MELILIYGGVVLLSILTISIYYSSNLQSYYGGHRLPPGKTGLPVIGESIEFVRNLQNLNLEKFSLKRMAKYSTNDVFRTSLLGDHVVMLCGAEGSKFLFSKGSKVVKRWMTRPVQRVLWKTSVLALDRYLKPAFLEFAKVDGLKTFVAVMDTMAQRHLNSHWHPLQVIEAHPSAKIYAFGLSCRLLLSIEDPNVVETLFDPMETWSLGLQSIPINLPGTQMNRSLKAGAILRTHIQQIVRQRRSLMESSPADSNKDNLISHFIQACDDDKDVTDGVLGTLLAGHESIASVIAIILKFISPGGDYPDVYRRVYQENMEIEKSCELLTWEDTRKMKYTWNVAREVMRIYPPAAFITREAIADFTYADYHIPKGYKMLTNIPAIHKDPKYFPEPEKFDPSRFYGEGPLPYTYMPFGGGPNKCPGVNYAQIVILVFIHNVVKRFKWEMVIDDEKIIGTSVPKPSHGLPIILHPHSPPLE